MDAEKVADELLIILNPSGLLWRGRKLTLIRKHFLEIRSQKKVRINDPDFGLWLWLSLYVVV